MVTYSSVYQTMDRHMSTPKEPLEVLLLAVNYRYVHICIMNMETESRSLNISSSFCRNRSRYFKISMF